MKKYLLLLLTTAMVGCTSHKPPVATGSWTVLNAPNFIPPNTDVYQKTTDNTITPVTVTPVKKEVKGVVNVIPTPAPVSVGLIPQSITPSLPPIIPTINKNPLPYTFTPTGNLTTK